MAVRPPPTPSPASPSPGSGTHPVTLTVTDNDGATGTASVNIVVDPVPNVPPTAVATNTSPKTGQGPARGVVLLGRLARQRRRNDRVLRLDVQRRRVLDLGQPEPHLRDPGTYTATLTVTDDQGGTGTATVTGIVVVANQAPTAAAGATPLTVKEDKVVTFSSAGSVDSDGTIASYGWTFGDSGTSTAANPTHTYANPGTYTATLTVTDNNGATGTATVVVTVLANQAPTAVANATPQTVREDKPVAFSSSGSSTPTGPSRRTPGPSVTAAPRPARTRRTPTPIPAATPRR